MNKKNKILISEKEKETLFRFLMQNPELENMAVIFCGEIKTKDSLTLIAKKILYLKPEHLKVQTKTTLEIKEIVYRKLLIEAETKNLSLIFAHGHQFAEKANHSLIDDENDLLHGKFIKENIPNIYFASLLVSKEEFKARLFDKKKEEFIEIEEFKTFDTITNNLLDNPSLEEFDRNYRAFTKEGQDIISNMKVALIGTSGTGWPIALHLVSLGVQNLLLVDPDKIEKTNLNRLPAVPYSKVGKFKAQVLSTILKQMNPKIKVNYRTKSVLDKRVQNELRNYNTVIGAVDDENIRLELNNFSVKYLKYYLDAGSEIILENGKIKYAGGQVTTVIPGKTPCLHCNQILDYKMISYMNLSEEEKVAEVNGGYIRGVDEPSASVVSINGVIASSLVNEFIALTTKVKPPNHYLFFDFMRKDKLMFPVKLKRNKKCIVCSRDGLYGYGDIEKQKITNKLPEFINMEDE